ncbi:hypothetical protein IW262DRAFT_1296026 [Armillaria fumosa]|nr:hypothetical protein IW262DRAFT_1296026 [Armillaria fumosa]
MYDVSLQEIIRPSKDINHFQISRCFESPLGYDLALQHDERDYEEAIESGLSLRPSKLCCPLSPIHLSWTASLTGYTPATQLRKTTIQWQQCSVEFDMSRMLSIAGKKRYKTPLRNTGEHERYICSTIWMCMYIYTGDELSMTFFQYLLSPLRHHRSTRSNQGVYVIGPGNAWPAAPMQHIETVASVSAVYQILVRHPIVIEESWTGDNQHIVPSTIMDIGYLPT